MRPVCRNVVPAGLQVYPSTCRYEAHRPAADAHLSGASLSWHWSAGVLATVVFGSCCAVKGFMLIISACTGFITSVAWA
jgi:hypothetical protein